MNKTRLLLTIIIALMAVVCVYLGTKYILSRIEIAQLMQQIQVQQTNKNAIVFAQLFIEKILKGTGEVVFDDRLKLENSVREINDQQIFDQWQKFLASENDVHAQQNTADLLALLFKKL